MPRYDRARIKPWSRRKEGKARKKDHSTCPKALCLLKPAVFDQMKKFLSVITSPRRHFGRLCDTYTY
jgi:hypothetical protein